ncbi:MAG: hypothetical protein V4702_01170 [Patescibacteria group bacterium]
MPRLPIPGGDQGNWGDILNDYLKTEHNDDGTHKASAVPDASGTTKGKLKLAGDLGGTADSPTVPAVGAHTSASNNAHPASAITFTPAGTVAATDVQAAIEEVASEAGSGVALSNTAPSALSDPASAGSAGTAARADHVHPLTGLATDTELSNHATATTGIHGVGASSVESTSGSQAKVDTHNSDTTSVHGVADTSLLETTTGSQAKVDAHAGAADPHTGYQKESEKGAASGYASLDSGTKVPTTELGGAGADNTKFLRGDQIWAVPSGGGAPADASYVVTSSNPTLTNEVTLAQILGSGLTASRPAPSASNMDYYWFTTDDDGGTLHQSNGVAWVPRAAGLTEAPANHASRHMAGGADSWTQFVRKTIDLPAITSNTAPADDPHLFFAVAANEVWRVEFTLYYEAGVTGDLSCTLTVPSGTNGRCGIHGLGIFATSGFSSDTAVLKSGDLTATLPTGGAGAGVNLMAVIKAIIRVSATGGNVRLRFAQRQTDTVGTIVYADSELYAVRVA